MARSATNIGWMVLGTGAALVLGLAVVFGPRIYREGRQLVGPIAELSRSEQELAALNHDLPFEPPEDGLVAEQRLEPFLAVRRALLPHYLEWESFRQQLEEGGDDLSWAATRQVLGALRDTFRAQTVLLREHGMSPAEFLWLERQVYDDWYRRLGETEADRRLREATEEDLEALAALTGRYGRSPALSELERRLGERLVALASSSASEAAASPNHALLERHRDDIAALDLARFDELHSRLGQAPGSGVRVQLGQEGKNRTLVIEGSAVKATPAP